MNKLVEAQRELALARDAVKFWQKRVNELTTKSIDTQQLPKPSTITGSVQEINQAYRKKEMMVDK